jgi:hypothetical protein
VLSGAGIFANSAGIQVRFSRFSGRDDQMVRTAPDMTARRFPDRAQFGEHP